MAHTSLFFSDEFQAKAMHYWNQNENKEKRTTDTYQLQIVVQPELGLRLVEWGYIRSRIKLRYAMMMVIMLWNRYELVICLSISNDGQFCLRCVPAFPLQANKHTERQQVIIIPRNIQNQWTVSMSPTQALLQSGRLLVHKIWFRISHKNSFSYIPFQLLRKLYPIWVWLVNSCVVNWLVKAPGLTNSMASHLSYRVETNNEKVTKFW